MHAKRQNSIAARLIFTCRELDLVTPLKQEQIDQAVAMLASPDSQRWTAKIGESVRIVVQDPTNSVEIYLRDFDSWQAMSNHKLAADTYERATFQPWIMLFERSSTL